MHTFFDIENFGTYFIRQSVLNLMICHVTCQCQQDATPPLVSN